MNPKRVVDEALKLQGKLKKLKGMKAHLEHWLQAELGLMMSETLHYQVQMEEPYSKQPNAETIDFVVRSNALHFIELKIEGAQEGYFGNQYMERQTEREMIKLFQFSSPENGIKWFLGVATSAQGLNHLKQIYVWHRQHASMVSHQPDAVCYFGEVSEMAVLMINIDAFYTGTEPAVAGRDDYADWKKRNW